MNRYFILFFLALIFFSLQISNRAFFTKGESREALVIQDMFSQNNFILPMRNGDQIPSKPPMYHWSAAGLSKIFGLNEFSIRAPSAAYAALSFITTLVFTKSLSASLIMTSSLEFNRSATSARVDMCFCFFLTLATYLIFQLIESEKKSSVLYLLLILGFICAILTKGPAGLAFPAAITAIYGLKSYKLRDLFKQKSFYLIFLTAVLAISASSFWYYSAYKIGGDDFLAIQMGRENLGRFVHTDLDPGHIKPFYFSLIYLLTGFFPWSLILPFALYQTWKERKELFKDKLFLYSVIWFLVYLAVVTITRSKRVVYLLPAYPACAYIIAKTYSMTSWGEKISKISNIIMAILAIIITLLVIFEEPASNLALSLGIKQHDIFIAKIGLEHLKNSYILSLASLLCLFALLFYKNIPNPNKTAFALCLICLVGNSILLPEISNKLTPKNFTQMFADKSKIVFFNEVYYSFSYYAGKGFKAINQPTEAKDVDFIIVSDEKLKQFESIFGKIKPVLMSNNPIIYGKYHAYLFSLDPKYANSDRRIIKADF